MEKIETELVDLDNIGLESTLVKIKEMSKSKELDIVVTPNVDHLVRLYNEGPKGSLSKIYQASSLCLCDSRIFEKLLRIKGEKVKEVIPGSTLTQRLFNDVITEDDKVLVIGGNDKVIEKLRGKYTHLNIFHHNPPMGFIDSADEVEKVIEVTKGLNANYIFLAVGSPRQEILAKILKDGDMANGVALCIGASILFIVGDEKRAPLWLQKLHCEWLYRMLQDPKRLVGRYAYNFISLSKVLKKI